MMMKIKQPLRALLLCLLAMAGLAACEDNTILVSSGQMPETGGLDHTLGVLSSVHYAENQILLEMNKTSISDGCYVKLTQPASKSLTFHVSIDESLAESYNSKYETQYPVFPTGHVTLSTDGTLTVDAGKKQSSKVEIEMKYDEGIEPGIYLLPLTVKGNVADTNIAEEYQTLYYLINVWKEFEKNKYELRNKEYIQIGYLDPEELNPLLINEIYLSVRTIRPMTPYWYDILFDIVNLQGAKIKYDKGNINLDIKDDLNYVLRHRKNYIMPLQAQHHKVCLSITGGGQGVGFSNFTNEECSSIIYQIKKAVDTYNLDGINIIDRNNSYNIMSNNLPNIKMFIKFMAELRKALPGKVITLAVSEETPEGIDKEVNNIRLGECIDYAWADEHNNAFNPWIDDSQYKVIAGLKKEQWGVTVTELTSDNEEQRRVEERTNALATDGVDKVFVHYLSRVKAGAETSASALWLTGGSINWPFDFKNNLWYGAIVVCPLEYLNIHSTVWLKDW